MNTLNLPALGKSARRGRFFERNRTDAFIVELAIVLYNSGVSLRKTRQVFGWIGIDCFHVAVWNWIQKFGKRLSATGRSQEFGTTVCVHETRG